MIAAAFPPTGGPGVQRSVKFAKYLPQFGWRPSVWTLDRIDGLPEDTTLLDDLPPEVTVHRWDGRAPIGARLSTTDPPASPIERAAVRIRAVGRRAALWAGRRPWPDDCAPWAQASLRSLVRLVHSDRIDLVYSTFSPASNHLLALMLKSRTHKPWVADFRDLWTDDFRYREVSWRRRQRDRRLEQQILEQADAVIGVSPSQTEILAGHVPARRGRFMTITNGFDPADFRPSRVRSACLRAYPHRQAEHLENTESPGCGSAQQAASAQQAWSAQRTLRPEGSAAPRERFVLAFVGRLDRWCAREGFFSGLKRFVERLGTDRDSFLLRITGHASRTTLDALRATGTAYAVNGYVTHEQAIREMQSATALLLLAPEGRAARTVICGKVFEYLASGRPILQVGPRDGECERVVESCEAGLTVAFDEEAVAEALYELYRDWRAGCTLTGCTPERAAPYGRVRLTGQLASLFDALVGATAASDGTVDGSSRLWGPPVTVGACTV